jgi:hypothetical protein
LPIEIYTDSQNIATEVTFDRISPTYSPNRLVGGS